MSEEKRTKPSRRRKLVAKAEAVTVHIVTAGQTLSERYHLVRELARGGMGVVFEAEDRELENRKLAVKVLPPELSHSAKAKKRLKKEAIAAMELTHPNILRLHGFEQDEDTAYLVMELLEGESLDEALAEYETLPIDQVLAIARDVCPALDYAHSKGVIHRDIKPANLMYEGSQEESTVKLTDFGIAYVVKDSMTRLTGLESAGTLLYVSPEQLRNDPPSPQSDQYSLAATLYELLSGDPPFAGAGLAHKILEAKVRPIEELPQHVNEALIRALSKEPKERFDSCGDLLEALEKAPEPVFEPEQAPPPKAEPKPEAKPEPQVEKKPAVQLEPVAEPKPKVEKASEQLGVNPSWIWPFRIYALLHGFAAYGLFALFAEWFGGSFRSDEETTMAVLFAGITLIPYGFYMICVLREKVEFSAKAVGYVSVFPALITLFVTFLLAAFDHETTRIVTDHILPILILIPIFSYLQMWVLCFFVARLRPPDTAHPPIYWLFLLTLFYAFLGYGSAFWVHCFRQYGRGNLGYNDTEMAIGCGFVFFIFPLLYYFVQKLYLSKELSWGKTAMIIATPYLLSAVTAIAAESYSITDFGRPGDIHTVVISATVMAYMVAFYLYHVFSYKVDTPPSTAGKTIGHTVYSLLAGLSACGLLYSYHMDSTGSLNSDEEIIFAIALVSTFLLPLIHFIAKAKSKECPITISLVIRSLLIHPLVTALAVLVFAELNYATIRIHIEEVSIVKTIPILVLLSSYVTRFDGTNTK